MLNSSSALIYQVTGLVCSFILPNLFLSCYGSEVNGLVSSITQFLGFISLCECGVGAVVQSALYKPLAEEDEEGVSRIVLSSERFFRRIAWIMVGYTVLLVVLYPIMTDTSFDFSYIAVLILVIALNSFAQYYFGMTYRLLLNADQLSFIQLLLQSATMILNTVACVILMKCQASIQVVKLASSLIFLLQPLVLTIVARRRYKIDRTIVLEGEPIPQKWNGLAQHVATVVLGNTDIVVLTFFSLKDVSIYTVYNLVANGVKQVVVSMTTGVQALFGNMLARGEKENLAQSFDMAEWLLHTLVTAAFLMTGLLLVPFVSVYTRNIHDANYIVPLFGYLLTMAQALYCLRLPYNIMVLAAGHYRQTQTSAILEALINIVISVAAVFRFGLVGVAIGTLVAMTYRTIYFVWYLSRNILYRDMKYFFLHLMVDGLTILIVMGVVHLIPDFFVLKSLAYDAWIVLAVKEGLVCVAAVLLVNGIFYRRNMKGLLQLLQRRKNNGK